MFVWMTGMLFGANAAEPLNAVVGDHSWHVLHPDRPPGAEHERIATHLTWVVDTLREADTGELSATQRAHRAGLLDALESYRHAGEYPEHDGPVGRRTPRWVDADETHCAVAYLVAVTGRDALVEEVQEGFEYATVSEMDSPGLLGWAVEHGFTPHELAMIQPTYDDGSSVTVPNPMEEELRRKRQAELDAQPRPIEQALLERIASTLTERIDQRECIGSRLGSWTVRATLSFMGSTKPLTDVVVVDADGAEDKPLTACFDAQLQKAASDFLSGVNYTNTRHLSHAVETQITPPSPKAVMTELTSRTGPWHRTETRQEAAACMAMAPAATGPYPVPVEVSSWAGRVHVDWPGVGARRDDKPEFERLQCLQSILGYGKLKTVPMIDTVYPLEVLPDGTVRWTGEQRPQL